MIITIDGPSGTGKSTIAKGVASRLGIPFFDTGAMYRSLAWKIIQEGLDLQDHSKICALLPFFQFEIRMIDGNRHYFVGEEEVTEKIRSQQISLAASQIATYKEVRKRMVRVQRKFGSSGNAVFEGRDMGTVVFPDADLKIFLTAKPEERATRRYREINAKFPDSSVSFEQVFQEMIERDQIDATRAISPLKAAKDAYLIDTTGLSITEVIDQIVQLARKKKSSARMKFSYRLVYLFARFFFKVFFRLRIYGLEHFRKGAAILAGNHTSFYDPPVLSISCPEEVHFLAKESLFKIPLLGALIRILNSHPVSRSASDANTFRLILQLLGEGKKLILFPEGNRSFDGHLQQMEPGLAFLVQKAKVRIIPVYLKGTFEAWPRTKRIPKFFGKMSCVFGSPIEWEEFEELDKKEAREAITRRVDEALHQLKDWLDRGAEGSPP